MEKFGRFKINGLMTVSFLFAILVLSGCSGSGGKADSCTDSASCIGTPNNGSSPTLNKLNLTCLTSHYYDSNILEWREITKERLLSGDLGIISVYSNSVSESLVNALTKVRNSESQFVVSSPLEVANYNAIPYIRCENPENRKISFEYKKLDSNRNIVQIVKGDLEAFDNIAYLPIVNEQFSNQFFTSGSSGQSSSSYTHQISLQARAVNSNPSDILKVTFSTDIQIPLKGMRIEKSESLKNYNLANRWSHYYQTNDGIANAEWDFASLVDSQETVDSISYDIRFVFKNKPILKMRQKVFLEEVIDFDVLQSTGEKIGTRQKGFFEKTINLSADEHFQQKFKINGDLIALDNNTELVKRNIPAGERWKLTYVYDFNQSVNYPASQTLLTPLKSECNIINNTPMQPIALIQDRAVNRIANNFYAYCHPETNNQLTLTPTQLATYPGKKKDLWQDYFSFRPAEVLQDTSTVLIKDLGHFYGINNVDFYIEGCVKFFTREATSNPVNPNPWEAKNIPNSECGSGDFSAFSIRFGDSIFNHTSDFASDIAITNAVNFLGTASSREISGFIFNNNSNLNVVY